MQVTSTMMTDQTTSGLGRHHWPLGLLWLLIAAGALYFLGGPTLDTGLVALLIVAATVAAAYRLLAVERAFHAECLAVERSASADQVRQRDEYIDELERLMIELLPILGRHVDATKMMTETNVTGLTDRFAQMIDALHQVIERTEAQSYLDQGGDLFEQSQSSLDTVVNALQTLLDRESEMMQQVNGLSGYTTEIGAMADAVQSVADQINLLSLNAAIEAARAGEQGRGFAVVADEVRKLAASSSATGDDIRIKAREISDAMNRTLALAGRSAECNDQLVDSSKQTILSVLARLREEVEAASRDVGSLRQNSSGLRDDISELLVNLQFQDRQSQMLAHVCGTLKRIESTIEDIRSKDGSDRHRDVRIVDELLNSMLTEYSTAEEKDLHTHGTTQSASGSALTFF